MVTPWPFTVMWRKVEWIIFVELTTFIGTVLCLFALIRLFLQEVTMFLSLDKQILKPEEAMLVCLLL